MHHSIRMQEVNPEQYLINNLFSLFRRQGLVKFI